MYLYFFAKHEAFLVMKVCVASHPMGTLGILNLLFFFLNFVFANVEQLITNLQLQKSKDRRELNNNEIVLS
jgi:hypothetical protein